jgi:NifU-like protein involved in Fe-S cluster formation
MRLYTHSGGFGRVCVATVVTPQIVRIRWSDMADLDEIYNTRILELAGAISHNQRLSNPDASASAHSKMCGSTIDIDLMMQDGRVSAFGQTVKACLLGQAAASVVAREIVGSSADDLHKVASEMRAMLKASGPPPTGRWADLGVLEPVRHYKARHTSTLLVFDAVEKALADIEAKGRPVPAPVR